MAALRTGTQKSHPTHCRAPHIDGLIAPRWWVKLTICRPRDDPNLFIPRDDRPDRRPFDLRLQSEQDVRKPPVRRLQFTTALDESTGGQPREVIAVTLVEERSPSPAIGMAPEHPGGEPGGTGECQPVPVPSERTFSH